MFTNLNNNPLDDVFNTSLSELANGVYREQRITLQDPLRHHNLIFRFFYKETIEDFSIVDVIRWSVGTESLFADFIKLSTSEWKNVFTSEVKPSFFHFYPNLSDYILLADQDGDTIEVMSSDDA